VHRSFVPFAASTRIASFPSGVVTRYQNRSPSIHVGRTPDRYTSGVVFQVMNFSARA